MNKKELAILGVGVILGCLLVVFLNKNKTNTQTTDDALTNIPIEDSIDTDLIDVCNKKVDNQMALSKFVANTDLAEVRKKLYENCISKLD